MDRRSEGSPGVLRLVVPEDSGFDFGERLRALLLDHPGALPVALEITRTGECWDLGLSVQLSPELEDGLVALGVATPSTPPSDSATAGSVEGAPSPERATSGAPRGAGDTPGQPSRYLATRNMDSIWPAHTTRAKLDFGRAVVDDRLERLAATKKARLKNIYGIASEFKSLANAEAIDLGEVENELLATIERIRHAQNDDHLTDREIVRTIRLGYAAAGDDIWREPKHRSGGAPLAGHASAHEWADGLRGFAWQNGNRDCVRVVQALLPYFVSELGVLRPGQPVATKLLAARAGVSLGSAVTYLRAVMEAGLLRKDEAASHDFAAADEREDLDPDSRPATVYAATLPDKSKICTLNTAMRGARKGTDLALFGAASVLGVGAVQMLLDERVPGPGRDWAPKEVGLKQSDLRALRPALPWAKQAQDPADTLIINSERRGRWTTLVDVDDIEQAQVVKAGARWYQDRSAAALRAYSEDLDRRRVRREAMDDLRPYRRARTKAIHMEWADAGCYSIPVCEWRFYVQPQDRRKTPDGKPAPTYTGKKPLTRNGDMDAARSEEIFDFWLDTFPKSNVGICARESGLDIVDLDIRVPDGKGGWRKAWGADFDEVVALVRQETGLELPATRVHQSASGGYHLLYRMRPDGQRLKMLGNAVSAVEGTIASLGRVQVAVDTKGEHGYVLAPGSVIGFPDPDHPKDRKRVAYRQYEVFWEVPVAALPVLPASDVSILTAGNPWVEQPGEVDRSDNAAWVEVDTGPGSGQAQLFALPSPREITQEAS